MFTSFTLLAVFTTVLHSTPLLLVLYLNWFSLLPLNLIQGYQKRWTGFETAIT